MAGTSLKSGERSTFHQLLLKLHERLDARSEPPHVLAQIKNDLAIIELNLGEKNKAISNLLESMLQSGKAPPDDLFDISCVTWSVLAYLIDRSKRSEAFMMTYSVNLTIQSLEKIRDEFQEGDRMVQELTIAMGFLSIISVVAKHKAIYEEFQEDYDLSSRYSVLIHNAGLLDRWTNNSLPVQFWLTSRLGIQ